MEYCKAVWMVAVMAHDWADMSVGTMAVSLVEEMAA
jgi:hypothetical protein